MALTRVLVLAAIAVGAVASARLRPRDSVTALAVTGTAVTKSSAEARIRSLKEANPYFSEEECAKMMDTKKRLGGSVPPAEFVVGCDEVCAMMKDMKEYWKSGETAEYACEHVKTYNCVYEGTPPVSGADIGC